MGLFHGGLSVAPTRLNYLGSGHRRVTTPTAIRRQERAPSTTSKAVALRIPKAPHRTAELLGQLLQFLARAALSINRSSSFTAA
jgi:hypothetical protein